MRRANRELRRAERERLVAVVLLTLVALLLAASTLRIILALGAPTPLAPYGFATALVLGVLAIAHIIDARRLERRVMDRIGQ